ncbi:MAG: glycosyltransferase family 2 protein [Pseudomonadota bacterium]
MSNSYCLLIPHYRHVPQLAEFLPRLAQARLPLLVVDDGSGPETVDELVGLLERFPWAHLQRLPENRGKGAAQIAGFELAEREGYSHVIVVDADGQHDPADIERLHSDSLKAPQALFSGLPQFGPDIPAHRLYGRMITNVLARVAAGDAQIRDAMCGLRLYPLQTVLALARQIPRRRMEFDTEVLVRARWAGHELRFVPTRVIYPQSGRSHFRMLRDNLRLTRMHILLLLQGILRRIAGMRPARTEASADG